MAFNKDQNEPKVPTSNVDERKSSDLLPRFYRTNGNKKFLQATVDQLNQPGTVKKLNGYVGRQTAKAVSSNDIFIDAASKERQDYQFEPGAVIQDYLGNTNFFKDYIDHINHVEVFDGNVKNHSRLNDQEFYSWNPQIDWDKFVNYQQYYWLPFGPRSIEVLGQQRAIQSTYTVVGVDEGDNVAYLFTPNALTRNPTLKLYRGQTYIFEINTPGHPFTIKTTRTSGQLDRYTNGVEGSAVEQGSITFTISEDSPDVLFYVSENDVNTGGVLQIFDIDENTEINLENDFLGKKNYTIPQGRFEGLQISNGMKLNFGGSVIPAEYSEGFWYVEGVGSAIKLINEKDLEIRTSYKQETEIRFDDVPFDQLPFSDTSLLPSKKDYITINRASPDKNPWSRYNRWFHQDVIIASAVANGIEPELDQSARAIRPIIEFVSGIKLHNYGIKSKKDVDVIDSFTTDVFSTIEGSTGYNIDGIDLSDGMRVLFTADSDKFVKNKIFKVNFITVTPPNRILTFDAAINVDKANNVISFATEHGLTSRSQITYINNDNPTILGLTNRKIYFVKVVDTFRIELHTNIQLNAQVDIVDVSEGIQKFEVFSGRTRQINLVEEADSEPTIYETVTINYGNQEVLGNSIVGNQGQTYWYNGDSWKLAQAKLIVNQPPLFDIFDSNGYSYADVGSYEGSTFSGTKVFSYKVGNGSVDKELGFPLSYRNINNIGDIVFDFNILEDKFAYKIGTEVFYKNTDVGFLMIIEDIDRTSFVNAWTTSKIKNTQPVVRVFKDTGLVNDFPIDVFNNVEDLDDLEVRVYANGRRIDKSSYTIETGVVRKFVKLISDVKKTDVITLRCFSRQPKNSNGYYELPISLQNNPLNNNVTQFTLGQVIDHVDSIIDNISTFNGVYPGNSNLRDLGNVTPYGTRFVQHSGPMNLSLYHLGSKSSNVIKALDQARNDYGKFKRSFIIAASQSGIDTDPKRHVDYILQQMSKDKPKTSPYYLSDMFGFSASIRIEHTIVDPRIKTYPLTNKFNLNTLSNKSVNIYLNGVQLLHGKDYVLGDDVFFELLIDINETDLLESYEYESTDGCVCPPTPTKLGLYPAFSPKIYIDDTYAEPTKVVQGHDGSITLAYDDYRDELILELETRIYNNIKVTYDQTIFDIFKFVPGYNRTTDYSRDEFDEIISKYFFQWTINIQEDYTKHLGFDRLNPFTYNYRSAYTPDGALAPASWRGIYRWLFDTDRPHSHPWECLGFSVEPNWWQDVYGPAPYTIDNFNLWEDIRDGIIREPGSPIRRKPEFSKPILAIRSPVNDQGKLIPPYESGYIQGPITLGNEGFFKFGDQAAVETAWRRSSFYPFALLQTCLLMKPNDVLGKCIDRSRIVKNQNGQLIYNETGLRLRLEDLLLPSVPSSSAQNRIYTSGLINYIVDYLTSENTARVDQYSTDLKSLTNKMSTRLGSFTSQPKYRMLLDSKNPSSTGGVFVPEENYAIRLNVSSAIEKVVYSGVLITKFPDGFEVRGYNFNNPYFRYFNFRQDDRVIRVGGISESYVEWSPGKIYVAGKVVASNRQYYRVKTTHTSGELFDESFYAKLPDLPIIGGREATLRKSWDTADVKVIAYGTRIASIQEVVDFLQGYGEYLTSLGFVFDDFNNNLSTITNWETSIKEFLFWTTQNWGEGAVISLSPAANKLIFKSNLSVVEDINNQFYGYSIFRVDSQELDPARITVYRSKGEFTLEPEDTRHGIFGATLYLVQKEHIALLDNNTLFNDVIYDPEAGYRQERIKVLGYVVSGWNGGFEIPGFIYDQAIIKEWEPWTDYYLGDIAKYKEFYYSAKSFLPGAEKFVADNWVLLEEKPEPELLPNWDYKAEQFTDFYDLDTDNLDSEQQRIAQHLIGYQKRQYLENIIKNDVSQYKFYQGMIVEKGTQNVLSKLFDVLSADDQDSLTFDEEWAFRVGEYGAVDSFNEVEFILDEDQFKVNPQPIELVELIDPNIVDFVYRQKESDIYIKPLNYDKNLWPAKNGKKYLRTPGFVRPSDVDLRVDSLDDISIDEVSEGTYVWCAFEGNSWNVYRFTRSAWNIVDVTYSSGKVTVVCNTLHGLTVGDYIGITDTALINGVHKIVSTTNTSFVFDKSISLWQPWDDQETVQSYFFESRRLDSVDDLNSVITKQSVFGELAWIENDGNSKWSVYQNRGVYRRGTISNSDPTINLNFGNSVTISESGLVSAVSDAEGITIYLKSPSDNAWGSINRISRPLNLEPDDDFGSLIKLSSDAEWLVVSSPAASSETGYLTLYRRRASGRYTFVDTISPESDNINNNLFGANVSIGKLVTPSEFYSNIVGDYVGVGTGAEWNIVRTGKQYEIVLTSRGINYAVGDQIIISGDNLGGTSAENDLIITVNLVDRLTGEIIGFDFDGEGVDDPYILAVSSLKFNSFEGRVDIYQFTDSTGWQFLQKLPSSTLPSPFTTVAQNRFGYDLSVSANAEKIIVSAPQTQTVQQDNGTVFVYEYDRSTGQYIFVQGIRTAIPFDVERFGESIALSKNNRYLAVGLSLVDSGTTADVGRVLIYKFDSNSYILNQTINSLRKEVSEQFGYNLEFMNDDQTLVVFSRNGSKNGSTIFDSFETTFDNESSLFDTSSVGVIDIYDRYNDHFIYGESLENNRLPLSQYGKAIAVGSNTILSSAVSEGNQNLLLTSLGQVYSYVKIAETTSWFVLYNQINTVDTSKIKRSYLYDKVENKIVTYLDIVDVNSGKIAGVADQEIKYKTYYDPATYTIGNQSVNVDDGMCWGKRQVGTLWWDLNRARFLDSDAGDVTSRTAAWNRTYDTASIDVYEWIETSLLPAAWNKLADTEKGLVQNISGQTKYSDDVYCVTRKYDSISQTFKETYYYWVKNKKITPQVEGRNISSYDVAKLIEDPVGYGYPCLAFIGLDSFILANVESYLKDKNIVLNVQYWITDNLESNYHSEWRLLSTNRNTVIPSALETKWIDSLVGKDLNDQVVPDIKLPMKQRYGIEFRPRQSMFVNRIEAVKQFVDRVNLSLSKKLIVDDYDLSDLESYELPPSEVSGTWDAVIDTSAELRFVPTATVRRAVLAPITLNGRIIDIKIVDSGNGYGTVRSYQVDEDNDPITWYGPDIAITGSGIGAKVKSVINAQGQVIGSVIVDQGQGYNSETFASIREFAVLIRSDIEALGSWSIYQWNELSLRWIRFRSQAYDVRKYWDYLDWYETGYNQFVKVDYLVENTYELVTTNIEIGSIAKVKNIGSGGWLLLEKYADKQTIDYTENFKVIGREKGTIKFSNKLYKFSANNLGFDGPLFDSDVYDDTPTTELRIIADTIKNKILVDEFRLDYLELFFASVRYAMKEQMFVDWAFKTSFVKSQHNVGELAQKVTYNSDNLEFYEAYINEVKPFRTKIREYVSNYSKLDPSQSAVTDFDLLPVINNDLKVSPLEVYVDDQATVNTEFLEIDSYPWKFWKDNIGFEITELRLIDQGEGYITRPIVKINGTQLDGGDSAEALAYISNGRVNRIELVKGGSKWIKSPIVTVEGGLTPLGRPAKVVAVIGNSLPRSSRINIKFDRISKTFEILELTEIETFSGETVSGSRTQFPLKWSPDIELGSAYVTINGVEILRSDYSLSTVENTSAGYTKYTGLLTFKVAPTSNSTILIEYNKNFNHLSATDRINFYYNPVTGQIGKELSQLMTGVDYGGVVVSGVDFMVNTGWDALPWASDLWDSLDPTLDDYLVAVGSPVSYSFRMPYVPEDGEQINIYISRLDDSEPEAFRYLPSIRIDDLDYQTSIQTNNNAIMKTFVGDGEIDIITLPETADLSENDRVIFRKITSDGSSNIRDRDYDTKISGGDISYSTATGLAPEDINLDGDDFISPATSYAPEEVVPGHVLDTLAIKVYHRPSGGSPNIVFNNHTADGSTVEFKIGQYFSNNSSVIVKVGNTINQISADYAIDYQNNNIVFVVPPVLGEPVSILSMGFNSASAVDFDHFVSDGETTEYITRAPWFSTATATVLVNGSFVGYELFNTDEQYTTISGQSWRSRIGIRFVQPPADGAIISYIIDSLNIETTASIVKIETLTYTGQSTYALTNPIGINVPLDQNVLVKTAQTILKPASAEYFDIKDNRLRYSLKDYKYSNAIVEAADITVYKGTELLTNGSHYIVDFNYTPTSYTLSIENMRSLVGGSGYTVGDIIEIVGGTLTLAGSPTKLEVLTLESSGSIGLVEIIEQGSYLLPPSLPYAVTGGTGNGALFNEEYQLSSDSPNITIELKPSEYDEDETLTVLVSSNADYQINNDNSITFNQTYTTGTIFEIMSFFNHNVLGIERTVDELTPAVSVTPESLDYYELSGKLGGNFVLRKPAASGDFVWVIKNGELLMHSVDYYLDSDYSTVRLKDGLTTTDQVQIIAFPNEIVHESFAYMQFKDMLNRTHYKRLNKAKSTRLDRDLTQFDREITVVDASGLDEPNPSKNVPGIIEINGERIEYFVKQGNVLSQLRRGTLGTGIPNYHSKGMLVQCLGSSETIPYKDQFIVTTHISDGIVGIIDLPFDPTDQVITKADGSQENAVVDIEVFVGGYRLKKNQYVLHSNAEYPYSPEGDQTFPQEFFINGSAKLELSTVPPMGVKIVVIKKEGKLWNDIENRVGKRLAKSKNPIAKFLTQTGTDWPDAYLDKYEQRILDNNENPLQTGDGNPLEY
jgi:hypothetical protein